MLERFIMSLAAALIYALALCVALPLMAYYKAEKKLKECQMTPGTCESTSELLLRWCLEPVALSIWLFDETLGWVIDRMVGIWE